MAIALLIRSILEDPSLGPLLKSIDFRSFQRRPMSYETKGGLPLPAGCSQVSKIMATVDSALLDKAAESFSPSASAKTRWLEDLYAGTSDALVALLLAIALSLGELTLTLPVDRVTRLRCSRQSHRSLVARADKPTYALSLLARTPYANHTMIPTVPLQLSAQCRCSDFSAPTTLRSRSDRI